MPQLMRYSLQCERLGWAQRVPRGRHDRRKIGLKRRILITGDYEVIHPDSRVDLGSFHHFLKNGEEINLEPQRLEKLLLCERMTRV